MPGNSAVKSDYAPCGLRGRTTRRLNTLFRNSARIAAAVGLLAGFGAESLRASEPSLSQGSTIQRSMRVIPRRYVISPSGAAVALNQTQHFGVTDGEGRPVAVRWNISGLGCYGASCGSIDEQGVYRPPASMPQPRIVTLEGVVITDPRYSVLTEIRLEDAIKSTDAAVASASSSEKPQLSAAPAPKVKDLSGRGQSAPLPPAVAAMPAVRGEDTSRTADLIPLPSAVAAAPTVASKTNAHRSELPPVPPPVAATPSTSTINRARTEEVILSSTVIVPPPTVKSQEASRRSELPPVSPPVAAAPTTQARETVRTATLLPLPSPASAASAIPPTSAVSMPSAPPQASIAKPQPSATTASLASSSPSPATVPSPSPQAFNAKLQPSAASAAVPAPPPSRTTVASATPQPFIAKPQPSAASASISLPQTSPPRVPSSPPQALIGKQQPSPVAGNGTDAASMVGRSLPQGTGTASSESQPQAGARVTYRGGLLTIDAQNATLADVLRLVGQKTGAMIDIPPGTGLEPIVEHAGPGTPNDVLTQLLNGSRFNFILVSSASNPQELAEVLLTIRGQSTEVATVEQTPTAAPEAKAVTAANLGNANAEVAPGRPHLELPKEPLSREALGDFMKEKHRQALEQLQQQYPDRYPSPPPQPQPPPPQEH